MKINLRYYKPRYLLPLVVVCWYISLGFFENLWEYEILQGVGPLTIVMLIIVSYDKWLWKLPLMNWINTVPNISGEYGGEIESFWEGKNRSKLCTLSITQTCSHIKIVSVFADEEGENETRSESTEAFVTTDEVENSKLHFYYHNRGSCKNGDTLNAHDGMSVLDIIEKGESIRLEGYYFTNRDPQTKGCMKVSKQGGSK